MSQLQGKSDYWAKLIKKENFILRRSNNKYCFNT